MIHFLFDLLSSWRSHFIFFKVLSGLLTVANGVRISLIVKKIFYPAPKGFYFFLTWKAGHPLLHSPLLTPAEESLEDGNFKRNNRDKIWSQQPAGDPWGWVIGRCPLRETSETKLDLNSQLLTPADESVGNRWQLWETLLKNNQN